MTGRALPGAVNGAPAEVPPHGPPSPMTALLVASGGLVALLYAYTLAGPGLPATLAFLAGALAFAAAAVLYRRFRVREAAFDGHLRDHAGDP